LFSKWRNRLLQRKVVKLLEQNDIFLELSLPYKPRRTGNTSEHGYVISTCLSLLQERRERKTIFLNEYSFPRHCRVINVLTFINE
jgi:hypothetical protein